jgi:hypothetical protein
MDPILADEESLFAQLIGFVTPDAESPSDARCRFRRR